MATIISHPAALSLAHNLGKFKISSESEVRFKLSLGEVVLIDESYTPSFDNVIEIDVKDIVIQELAFTLPNTVLFEQIEIVKTFSADIDGTVVTFRAIRAGVENFSSSAATWLKNNWLTWQPQVKSVGYSQPEWLSYYAQENCNVKVKFYMTDKTTYVYSLASLSANKCYSINTQFERIMGLHEGSKQGYFDIWVQDSEGVVLSYIQRYIYKESEDNDDIFLFENSLGGIDSASLSGASVFAPEAEHSSALYNEESEQLEGIVNRYYQKSSGWKSKIEAAWLWEIFRAKRAYKLDGAVIRKITIKDSSISESSQEDMKSFDFVYRMALDKGLLNIPRSADPLPSNLEITTPEGLFFLAPRLVEFPDAEITGELLFPVQSPWSQEWKKLSYQQLISEIDKSIGEGVVRMEIDSSLGWMLGKDETTVITVRVLKRWNDLTSLMESWEWKRDSGDAADDQVWNLAHTTLQNQASISFEDLGNAMQTNKSCKFTIKATYEELIISETIEL